MSFRKKALTRPNLGTSRKKPELVVEDFPTQSDICNEPTQTKAEDIQTNVNVNNSASQGTKLSKRVKPKVNLGNTNSIRAINDKAASKPPDTGQNEQGTVESIEKKSKCPAVDINHVASECRNPQLNTSEDKNKIRLTEEKTPKILENKTENVTEKNETVQDNKDVEPKDSTSSTSKRLSKRLKVGPKLSGLRPTKKENSSTKPSIKENYENKKYTDETATNDATENTQTLSTGSKLQKRKKVMPNLKIPPKNNTKNSDKTNDNNSTQKENTMTTQNESKDTETSDETITSEIKENASSDQAQKTKHVHFESAISSSDITKNNDTEASDKLINDTVLSEQKEQPDKKPAPSPSSKPSPSILKKDNVYDYSSQSEGEATPHTTTSLGKGKKVFKPNLGARRRKRLSSFSAYSSCDDEDTGDAKSKARTEDSCQNQDSGLKNSKGKGNEGISEGKVNRKRNKKRKSQKTVGSSEEESVEEEEDFEEEEERKVKKKKSTRTVRKIFTEERDISTLTMQELIFYRPKSLQKAELRINKNDDLEETAEIILPTPAANNAIDNDVGEKESKDFKEKKEEKGGDADDMAPQVMLDENGDVVINEQSLTIRKKVDDSELKKTAIVYEDALSTNTHRRRVARVKRWKMDETLRFYKALSQIGTDFTLMSQVFTRFTRNELKKKFKQEEKVNCDLIDMALSNRLPLNMEIFLRGKEEKEESIKELLEGELDKAASKRSGGAKKNKNSKKAASLSANMETTDSIETIDDEDAAIECDTPPQEAPLTESELPECFVRLEKTKAMEIRPSEMEENSQQGSDDDDDNTDFKRTLKNNTDAQMKGRPPNKKKRLRVMDSDGSN